MGITDREEDNPYRTKKYDKAQYKNANDLNRRACILINGNPKSLYARVLIRKVNSNGDHSEY